MMAAMLLRPMSVSDEEHARNAHRELAQDAFDFLLDLRRREPWPAYLARLEGLRLGFDVPEGWVPATFLVAEVDQHLVGRISIRHHLNPYLAEVAGHIGIGVRPDFRRRGYGTTILRQSLAVAASTGLAQVLLTCDANDVGSVNVILECGGIPEDATPTRGRVHKCRFWVETSPRAVSVAPQRSRPSQSAHGSAMQQRVSVITLGVADVKRSRAFYERLGWRGQDAQGTVYFPAGGLALALVSRDSLAVDARIHDEQAGGFSGVVLAQNVRSEDEVDEVITSAQRAGATVTKPAAGTSSGGYGGFFTDPDGHVWEVAHNP